MSEHTDLAAYLTGLAANGDFHHDRVLLTRAAELLLAADPVEEAGKDFADVLAPAPAAEPDPVEPEAEAEVAADPVEAPADGA